MRLIRTSAAVSLGLLVALVPAAHAAKKPAAKSVAKPVCNLITDAAKDTFLKRSFKNSANRQEGYPAAQTFLIETLLPRNAG